MWKDIKGYEGMYLISDKGEIASLKFDKFKILKLNTNKHQRYAKIFLSKYGESKYYSVHRLVAMAYISNPNNLPQVNHIDGNRFNNNVSNLEWVTISENCKHSFKKLGRVPSGGAKKGNSNARKLTDEQIKDIRNSNLTLTKLATKYNCSIQNIHKIKTYKSWNR